MKKTAIVLFCLAVALTFSTQAWAWGEQRRCTTIDKGKIVYPPESFYAGKKIKIGFDEYGYNYQGQIFNGWAVNFAIANSGLPPYEGSVDGYYDKLAVLGLSKEEVDYLMIDEFMLLWPDCEKDWIVSPWNDGWKSNEDCDGDNLLDGGPRVALPGSGGWATYQWRGSYQGPGYTCDYDYGVTMIIVPENAVLKCPEDEFDLFGAPICTWYVGKTEIGRGSWDFGDPRTHFVAKILETNVDPCFPPYGIVYVSPNVLDNGALGGVDWSSVVKVPVEDYWGRHRWHR